MLLLLLCRKWLLCAQKLRSRRRKHFSIGCLHCARDMLLRSEACWRHRLSAIGWFVGGHFGRRCVFQIESRPINLFEFAARAGRKTIRAALHRAASKGASSEN